ncbi:TPA: hypothetical protein N0F65_000298 [Lagenidium giganteum]|uniref:Uncharacterized protein n=1 Tax=Lagenidium giganteum TaxID=4803 RepID=A0AAV2Z3X1_9STRA|nr:TPA: hypothetical protein N0F65_000298 [Lagenidium giganteum]
MAIVVPDLSLCSTSRSGATATAVSEATIRSGLSTADAKCMSKTSPSGIDHVATGGIADAKKTNAPVRVLKKAMSDSVMEDKTNAMSPHAGSTSSTPTGTKQRKYERKTKRFIWPEELHRLFVAAIFDVGLKNASPKALLALMGGTGPHAGLTTEHLKSHLQKYRLNYERSRQEFLQYYDQSTRRNLKRRRKNPKSEHNTMFVFPICAQSKSNGSDSDDSGDDEAGETSDSTEHPTPRGADNQQVVSHGAFGDTEALKPGYGHTAVRPHPTQAPPPPHHLALHHEHQQQQAHTYKPHPAGIPGRVDYSANIVPGGYGASANPLVEAGGVQRHYRIAPQKTDRPNGPNAGTNGSFRYALSMPMGDSTAGSTQSSASASDSTTNALMADVQCDPQWSILSTLMSPHISGMTGTPNAPAAAPLMPGADGEPFSLNEEPTHLQLQMHMAMQAQMNLHRQMLMRKVEVSQHIINNSSDAHQPQPNRTVSELMGYNQQQQWGSHMPPPPTSQAPPPQMHQHHAPPSHQRQPPSQQQQHLMQQRQIQAQAQARAAAAAACQSAPVVPTQGSSRPPTPTQQQSHQTAPPQQATQGQRQQQPGQQQGQSGRESERPSVQQQAPPSTSQTSSTATTSNAPTDSNGQSQAQASSSIPGDPTASMAQLDVKGEDDSLDLYRWDRIDLNMDLDDDDLFGFLKS